MKVKTAFEIALLFLLIQSVPRILNYQGKLLDRDGVGVNETLAVTFRLYTSETGTSPVWEEVISNVIVRQGLFSVELSGFPDSVDFSVPYWLEIEIEGERLSPRERLTASPYALYAYRSESVEKGLRSLYSSGDGTRRYGEIMLRAGSGATISDSGDSIMIIIGAGTSLPTLSQVLATGRVATTYIDMDGNRIINLGAPISDNDAVNKAYVDSHISPSDWLLLLNRNRSAGSGLSFVGDSLNLNVDNTTIQIANDTLKLAAGAISGATIADSSVSFLDLNPSVADSVLFYGGIDATYTAGETISVRDAVYLGSPLAGWVYRQPIYISSNGTNLVDYPIKVILRSTNSSFWAHRAPGLDGADIRFTASDGKTLLSHYLWSWVDGVKAVCWVKVPSIPASGGTTIYLYYGNSSATSTSNGSATFDLFEDFEGETISSLESAGWAKKYTTNTAYASPPTYSIETDGTSVLHISNPYSYGHCAWFWIPSTRSDGSLMFMFRIMEDGTSGAQRQIHPVIRMDPATYIETGSANRHHIWTYKAYSSSYDDAWNVMKYDDQTTTILGNGSYDFSTHTWYSAEFRAYSNRIEYLIQDSLLYSGTDTRYSSGRWGPGEYESHIHFDNVAFRKFVYPEPSVTIGSEEMVAEGLYRAIATSQVIAENFLGFALTSGIPGSSVKVRIFGVVSGFSSLSPGANYYLTNSPGVISRTPGSYIKRVGTAISSNRILITR